MSAHGEANTCEPGDEVVGGWSLERLLLMNDRFAARLEQAFARGLERRIGDEAPHRLRLAGNGGMACAHCGTVFVPFCCTQKYCSQNCNQRAYLKRRGRRR
jgi:hypothetical protein